MSEREILEVDVLFVGAGPAGLGGAIRLSQLAKSAGKPLSICVIDKAREFGAHSVSGALMNPRAIRELFPDFLEQGCPVEGPVEEDQVLFLTEDDLLDFPVVPPALDNQGNYIVSLGRLVRWLAKKAEEAGIDLFAGFPGVELLVEDGRVVGVRTGDKGIDKHGQKKGNFEPGVDIRAKVTVIGEGSRGHLARQAMQKFGLDKGRNPQVYATGVKEIWELPEGHVHVGRVVHTMGWPLKRDAFGGGFVYSMSRDRIDIGFVVGLDYRDPFLDPHHEFQRFKTHPRIRKILEGGKMAEYGAKTISGGGWLSVPRLSMPGCLLVGEAGGLLDAMRLKGVHLAIQSGMLAAETAWEALEKNDFGADAMAAYERRVERSTIKKDMWPSRYFKHGFKLGFLPGILNSAITSVTNGLSPFSCVRVGPGHERMRTVEQYYGRPDAKPQKLRYDDTLTFRKTTDVFHSGTIHDEDTPCHLKVLEPNVCVDRCTREYGNPCQHFCPAGVYEWVEGRLQINFANCVHCKTCDIMDPYGIIRWVPPEGGGGPGWQNL